MTIRMSSGESFRRAFETSAGRPPLRRSLSRIAASGVASVLGPTSLMAALVRRGSSAFVVPFVTVAGHRFRVAMSARHGGEPSPARASTKATSIFIIAVVPNVTGRHLTVRPNRGSSDIYFRFRRATLSGASFSLNILQSVAICLHCLSTIAADPEPMCRGSGINRRAWRTECRRRLGIDRSRLVLALVARSSAHCARPALGGIGTRAARRAPSIHVAALEAPSVATE